MSKYEPDKRWKVRLGKVMDAIEQLEALISDLEVLDSDATPAVWSEYATEARGALCGAKTLLMTADMARTAHINGEWPCSHNVATRKP